MLKHISAHKQNKYKKNIVEPASILWNSMSVADAIIWMMEKKNLHAHTHMHIQA